jgi:ATP-binding cassette subfamily F protein 3
LKKRALDTFREVSLGKAGKGEAATETIAKAPKPKLEGKAYHQRLKQVTKDVQNAERKINRLEEDNKKLEERMADMSIMGTPAYDEVVLKYETNKKKLEETMEKWELASLELEELENQ